LPQSAIGFLGSVKEMKMLSLEKVYGKNTTLWKYCKVEISVEDIFTHGRKEIGCA